jgi:hypothetical protein
MILKEGAFYLGAGCTLMIYDLGFRIGRICIKRKIKSLQASPIVNPKSKIVNQLSTVSSISE